MDTAAIEPRLTYLASSPAGHDLGRKLSQFRELSITEHLLFHMNNWTITLQNCKKDWR